MSLLFKSKNKGLIQYTLRKQLEKDEKIYNVCLSVLKKICSVRARKYFEKKHNVLHTYNT